MARGRDAVKERYWRGVIGRYRASGLGATKFCARESIPEHRFYWWQRALRERDGRGGQRRSVIRGRQRGQAGSDSQSEGLEVAGTGDRPRGDGMASNRLSSARVTGDTAARRGHEEHLSRFLPVDLPLSLALPVEVVHPRGHVIRVPAVFDAVTLKRILAVLDSSADPSGED